MKIYVIWNKEDGRPFISRNNFGNILAFSARENAQAYLKDIRLFKENDSCELREFYLTQ